MCNTRLRRGSRCDGAPLVHFISDPITPTRHVRLIVLDRDGVINYDSEQFIKSPDEWRPVPGSLEAIARLNHAGFRVVGYYFRSRVEDCKRRNEQRPPDRQVPLRGPWNRRSRWTLAASQTQTWPA